VADDQFLSFEDALDRLRLQEEELKRLVSEGEIRAFREGDTMKLRAQDVETLRGELSGESDGGADAAGLTDVIVFEDDDDMDDEAGMATEEITDVETILQEDDDIETIELDEESAEDLTETAVRRRTRTEAPVLEEDEKESTGVKVAIVLTSIIMILGIPVVMSVAKGQVSSLARAIAEPLDFDNALPAINNR
jgi:hypothetical protein